MQVKGLHLALVGFQQADIVFERGGCVRRFADGAFFHRFPFAVFVFLPVAVVKEGGEDGGIIGNFHAAVVVVRFHFRLGLFEISGVGLDEADVFRLVGIVGITHAIDDAKFAIVRGNPDAVGEGSGCGRQ